MDPAVTVLVGRLTRRRFAFHFQFDSRPFGGAGSRFEGREEGVGPVLIHRVPREVDGPDEWECRTREAIDLHLNPAVAGCTRIRQLIDWVETEPFLYGIYEWGDLSLVEFLAEHGDSDLQELETAIRHSGTAALRALHSIGHVHSDVAPNNFLRVGSAWKLIDLDNALPAGTPWIRFPRLRYRPDGVATGTPRDYTHDWNSLEKVLARIRSAD